MKLRVSEAELRELFEKRLGVVEPAEFDKARPMAARLQIPPGFLLEQLANAWGVPFVDLKISDVKPEALSPLPEEYARRHRLIAFDRSETELKVAMCDPRNRAVIDEIERMTKFRVIPYLAPGGAIDHALLLYKGDLREMLRRALAHHPAMLHSPRAFGEDNGATVDLLTQVLEYATVARASDIHVEPYEHEGLVRYRVDGLLHEVLRVPASVMPSRVARIKVLSALKIDEKRIPQDGRFEATSGGIKSDMRVSIVPTHWGEKVVIRVLSKDNLRLDLEDLGLSTSDYQIVLRNILRPFGMILVTGPTGSGKSTSLYAMLIRLGVERQHHLNVSTIEDPIEYTLPRVNQIPVNPAAGIDFATGLRALLRQEPDVIMVGEIRDRETAEIGVRAALVGRLLISTLHTNDSTGAVARLLDMGIEPFLLASTLTLVVAQRLVRRLCRGCRESVVLDPATLAALRRRRDFARTLGVLHPEGVIETSEPDLGGVRVFQGKGCRQFGGSGFRGRVAVMELFEVDESTQTMIMERRAASEIRAAAIAGGMKTMFDEGLAKVLLGETTIDEIFRVAV